MSTSKKIKAVVKPVYQGFMDLLPTRAHVVLDYFRAHYRWPDLNNPQSFSEKIIWRKLHDRDARMPDLVDKIKVKEIMAKKFGDDFIIPTLAVYKSIEEMDFNRPPLSRPPYVLKTNHGSATNIFARANDGSFNPAKIRSKLKKYLAFNHAAVAEEWAYSQVEPRIFAEPLIETPEGYLADYKFHVFSGTVYAIEVIHDRFRNYGVSFFNRSWNKLNLGYARSYPRYKGNLKPPKQINDMIKRAEQIGGDFSYVRVDLYVIDGVVKFGEMTFYPGAGHDKFDSSRWDFKFGQQWKLNIKAKDEK